MSERNDWNESLFGCFNNWSICCYGFWCAPCLFGSNVKKLDGGNCCINCCVYCALQQISQCWLPQYFKRQKLRQMYNLKESSTCGDVPATLCCSSCALCQEAREMKSRDHSANRHIQMMYQTNSYPVTFQPAYNQSYSRQIVSIDEF